MFILSIILVFLRRDVDKHQIVIARLGKIT